MGTLRRNTATPSGEGAIPTDIDEARGLIWETLDRLEDAGFAEGVVYSLALTEMYRWAIERTGSSFTAMKWMAAAMQDMAELGPKYEFELHGGMLQ